MSSTKHMQLHAQCKPTFPIACTTIVVMMLTREERLPDEPLISKVWKNFFDIPGYRLKISIKLHSILGLNGTHLKIRMFCWSDGRPI